MKIGKVVFTEWEMFGMTSWVFLLLLKLHNVTLPVCQQNTFTHS